MRAGPLNGALTAFDRYRVFAQSQQAGGVAVAGTACSLTRITQCHCTLSARVYVNKQAESQQSLNVTL